MHLFVLLGLLTLVIVLMGVDRLRDGSRRVAFLWFTVAILAFAGTAITFHSWNQVMRNLGHAPVPPETVPVGRGE